MTLEVAVFTVNKPQDFGAIQATTHELLAKVPGFIRSVRLRSSSSAALFADLVAWESLATATAAAKQVQQDERFVPLMSGIEQIRLYGHYEIAAEPSDLLFGLNGAPIVEIAAYGVKDQAAVKEVHPKVYETLRGHHGYRVGAPGQQHEDRSQFLDVIAWASPDDCQRASQALQSVTALAPFFGALGEMKLFELFHPLQ